MTGLVRLLADNGIRSIVFLGDSVGGQYWQAFEDMLRREGVTCWSARESDANGGFLFDDVASKWLQLLPPDMQTMMGNDRGACRQRRCGSPDENLLITRVEMQPFEYLRARKDYLVTFVKYLHPVVDAISFNHGLHVMPSEMAAMLKMTLPLLDGFGSRPGKLAIFREVTAQHFVTSSAGLSTGSCEDRSSDGIGCASAPGAHPGRNVYLHRMVSSTYRNIHVEQLWEVTRDRGDMHVVANTAGATDCTHFCFCPLFWEGVFTSLYNELVARYAAVGSNRSNSYNMARLAAVRDEFNDVYAGDR